MEILFVPPVVPPAVPGQPPYYYVIYGTLLSLMGITLSSAVFIAFDSTKKGRNAFIIGCLLSICFGVYCGNMVHPLVAVAVGVVLTIISIFVYNKSCE